MSSPSSSSSSSSLILFTGIASFVAVGSIILVRRLFSPNRRMQVLRRNRRRRFNNPRLERVDLGIGVGLGPNRCFLEIKMLISMQEEAYSNFNYTRSSSSRRRRRFLLVLLRIGGNSYPEDLSVLVPLFILRSWMGPILLPLLDDIQLASIAYFRSLMLPRVSCTIA